MTRVLKIIQNKLNKFKKVSVNQIKEKDFKTEREKVLKRAELIRKRNFNN